MTSARPGEANPPGLANVITGKAEERWVDSTIELPSSPAPHEGSVRALHVHWA